MKTITYSALAALSLAMTPLAANAEDENRVSYEDAMQCSALFTLLSSASEGKDAKALEDMAVRWQVVAMDRDGSEDGSVAEAELAAMVDDLTSQVESITSQQDSEDFLLEGIEFCEGKHQLIADEIAAIKFE